MQRQIPPAAALFAAVVFAAAVLACLPAAASDPLECAAPAAAVLADADPAAALDDLLAADQPQENACIIICEPWFQTAMYWGIGADCNASRSHLTSQVGAEASSTGPGLCSNAGAAFGYCGWTLVITAACHWDPSHGAYVTDGYGNIKCKDYC